MEEEEEEEKRDVSSGFGGPAARLGSAEVGGPGSQEWKGVGGGAGWVYVCSKDHLYRRGSWMDEPGFSFLHFLLFFHLFFVFGHSAPAHPDSTSLRLTLLPLPLLQVKVAIGW